MRGSRLPRINRLKTKMLLFGLCMSIIPFLILGYINLHTSKDKVREEVDRANQIYVENTLAQLDMLFLHTSQSMQVVQQRFLNERPSDEDAYFLLNTLLKTSPYMEEVALFNQDGEPQYLLNRWKHQKLDTPMERDNQLLTTIQSGKPYIGGIVRSVEGKLLVTVAIPHVSAKGVKGGMYAKLNVKQLLEQVTLRARYENEAYLFVTDGKSDRFADPFMLGKPSDGSLTYYEQAVPPSWTLPDRTDKPVIRTYQAFNGDVMVNYAMRSSVTHWVIMLEQSSQTAFAAFSKLEQSLLFTTLFIAFIVLGISIVFSVSFSRLMEKIESAVQKIAGGDLSVRIPVTTSDEIGRLAASCNEMAQSLEIKTNQLLEEKKRLDLVVSGMGMGLILVDESFRIRWINQTASAWFQDAAHLLGKDCHLTIGQQFSSCSSCMLRTRQMVNQKQTDLISSRVDQDGRVRFYRHQVFPLHPEKESSAFLEVIEDITEKRELEAAIAQADKLAAVGLLASGIAHEINNPLGILSLYGQDLRDRLVDEDIRDLQDSGELTQYLDTMDKQINRCKEITTRLLHFSGKSPITVEKVDIHQVLADILILLSHEIRVKQVTVNQSLLASAPFLLATPGQLQQIVLNLLTNALYATQERGNIEIATNSPSNDRIRLSIRDDGCGIPAADLPHVLEPFYTTKPPGKGTGLGLSVCYGIVKNVGGEIEIESTPNIGTTVTVILPSAKGE
ncbi:HAMP domain-containing protein [Brevibacillus brevis]|uniref:histidine kinase n=1 Tax=Brevibacillus brevis TaxID=1393 RepID=A0A2Z4MPQ4_BREBE|nr:ATP-binding protein [Brevibacillus brevis]AWX58059.1 HAMP domain-containing protein [Brevibacillus brevis]